MRYLAQVYGLMQSRISHKFEMTDTTKQDSFYRRNDRIHKNLIIMNTELFSSHGFELSDTELAQFQHFLSLFMTYNGHTNLSAIRDEDGIVEKHFVDSLY